MGFSETDKKERRVSGAVQRWRKEDGAGHESLWWRAYRTVLTPTEGGLELTELTGPECFSRAVARVLCCCAGLKR